MQIDIILNYENTFEIVTSVEYSERLIDKENKNKT